MPGPEADVSGGRVNGLVVEVVTTGERAGFTVRGDIDLQTAPTLGALVSAVLDHGHDRLTLDAAGVGFMDAAGVRVIVAALNRIDAVGGQLVISTPSAAVMRVLEIVGLSARVGVDAPSDERTAAPSPVGAGLAASDLPTDVLRRVAAIPANRDVIDAAFGLVVSLAGGAISQADGVSISLRRRGRLATVAASDESVTHLDHLQYDTGQGPCVAAAQEGRQFVVDSARSEQRWPAFMPHAVQHGITSMLSTPLMSRDGPVGSINLYGRRDRAFGDDDCELAASVATTASRIVARDALNMPDEDIATRLEQALRARQTIAHAQGVLMAREAITADAAYSWLRRRSRSTSQTMVDLAREVVEAVTHAADDA